MSKFNLREALAVFFLLALPCALGIVFISLSLYLLVYPPKSKQPCKCDSASEQTSQQINNLLIYQLTEK